MLIGTTVYLLPTVHPVALAEDVAMCDVLSGGRFVFGVGLGWRSEEFAALGISMDERSGRFEEALEIINALWRGEVVEYRGKFFSLSGIQLVLRPSQTPRPPIWVGANASTRAVRRAARLGDGWVISSHIDFEAVRRLCEVYLRELEVCGKPRGTIALLRNFFLADSAESALRGIRRFFESTYVTYGEWGLFEDVLRLEKRVLTGESLARGRIIVGGPDECAAQIGEYIRWVPVDFLVLRMDWPGMPSALVEECIYRVGQELLPRLRSMDARGG
jgi:alkanesulfonate monooxygenase SsuD/methylene tetrahydromethanopterin reductase-like flavin-dependent oxidoreductase (luciferase family)